jgi:fatty acid desaturase
VTAGDVLTLSELRELRRTSALRGAGLVLHAWTTITIAMVVYAVWPSALTLVLAITVIGSRQLGLLVVMHEAAHWLLFPSMRANTLVASWLCASPLFAADLKSYRRAHHLHHRHTQEPEDPDLALAAPFPVTRARFWRDVLRDLSGFTLCARIVAWPGWRQPRGDAWRQVRRPLITNAVLFTGLALIGHWELYLLLWVLPLATWHQLLARLRSIAEHAMVPDDRDPLRNTRTTSAGPLARVFLAPYWVNYHIEHHVLVFVPCWKLRRAHALLRAKGYHEKMALAAGYLDVIRRAMSDRARCSPSPPAAATS